MRYTLATCTIYLYAGIPILFSEFGHTAPTCHCLSHALSQLVYQSAAHLPLPVLLPLPVRVPDCRPPVTLSRALSWQWQVACIPVCCPPATARSATSPGLCPSLPSTCRCLSYALSRQHQQLSLVSKRWASLVVAAVKTKQVAYMMPENSN